MTERILGPEGSTRRRRFLWVPILLVACTSLFLIAGAQAVHNTKFFQLDGDAQAGTKPASKAVNSTMPIANIISLSGPFSNHSPDLVSTRLGDSINPAPGLLPRPALRVEYLIHVSG